MASSKQSFDDQHKAQLRQLALAKRVEGTPRQNRRIVGHLLRFIQRYRPSTIAAVWPLAGEVDLRPLCKQLVRGGYHVLLPETPPKGHPLVFRQWHEARPMRAGRFGTLFPTGARRQPEVILVPLVAFDRQGGRLGYGGGYYDRTLPLYPDAIVVGYGFASQECAQVPMGPHDCRLPFIVTEHGVIHTHQH